MQAERTPHASLPLASPQPINATPPHTHTSRPPLHTTPQHTTTAQPSYDELTAHERIQVGGTKGGITTKEGDYAGHYEGEGTRTNVEHTGEAVRGGGGGSS